MVSQRCRSDGYIRKLFFVGLGNDSAIAHEKGAVNADVFRLHIDDEQGRRGFNSILRYDNLKEGAKRA